MQNSAWNLIRYIMILVRQSSAAKPHEKKFGLGLKLPSDTPKWRICSVSLYIQMALWFPRAWKCYKYNRKQKKNNLVCIKQFIPPEGLFLKILNLESNDF